MCWLCVFVCECAREREIAERLERSSAAVLTEPDAASRTATNARANMVRKGERREVTSLREEV